MTTELDVYKAFRSVQSSILGKGYRVPKDWDKYYGEKLTINQQKNLTRSSKYFTTLWNDIDIIKYMECGFELYPKFSYHKFFDKKVMQLYIVKDKIVKNDLMNIKKDIIASSKFVYQYMAKETNINKFQGYCRLIEENRHVIISHYMTNKISSAFLCWMIAEGFLSMYDNDYEMLLPFIMKNYRSILIKLQKCRPFLDEIKEKLNGS